VRWVRRKRAAVEAWLGPLWSGALSGATAFVVVALGFFWAAILAGIPSPSADLLRDLADFGGALFIAYSVAFSAAAISDHWDRAERQSWIGFGVGIGTGGLVAIGSAIATAAHVEAGHSSALDLAGLAAAIAGTLMLALVVLTFAVRTLDGKGRSGRREAQQLPEAADRSPGRDRGRRGARVLRGDSDL